MYLSVVMGSTCGQDCDKLYLLQNRGFDHCDKIVKSCTYRRIEDSTSGQEYDVLYLPKKQEFDLRRIYQEC